MNKVIDVLYVTHGSQEGAQVHKTVDAAIWTVFTQQGLERTYRDAIAYARFMTRGY